MVIKEGKFSACCFLISTSLILLPILDGIRFPLIKELNSRQNILWFLPCFFIILILCLRRNYSGFMFQVRFWIELWVCALSRAQALLHKNYFALGWDSFSVFGNGFFSRNFCRLVLVFRMAFIWSLHVRPSILSLF